MASNQQIAKIAFFSLNRMRRAEIAGSDSPGNIPADLLGAAELFVEQAFDLIQTMGSGRNPRSDARAVAEEAVIRYVVLRMEGQDPISDGKFGNTVRAWSKVSAKND